ncbi:acetyltransferase, partial [Vibrio cholerae]|nr:acetyltransferase [Vibrio cholerae]
MVAVVLFEFSGMRCQPLRRALGVLSYMNQKLRLNVKPVFKIWLFEMELNT